MKQNSLIEVGSKANVVLKFKKDTTINGKLYKAQEPFLFLKDVIVNAEYRKIDKTSKASLKNRTAHTLKELASVSLYGVNFTRKICSMMTTYVGEETAPFSTFETATAHDGELFLTASSVLADTISVFDKEMESVDFIYDEASNSIISNDFIENEEYLISFSTGKIGTLFYLETPNHPYFSMEIHATGNVDKKQSFVYMKLETVSLQSVMDFNFTPNGRMDSPLEFVVISSPVENKLLFSND